MLATHQEEEFFFIKHQPPYINTDPGSIYRIKILMRNLQLKGVTATLFTEYTAFKNEHKMNNNYILHLHSSIHTRMESDRLIDIEYHLESFANGYNTDEGVPF